MNLSLSPPDEPDKPIKLSQNVLSIHEIDDVSEGDTKHLPKVVGLPSTPPNHQNGFLRRSRFWSFDETDGATSENKRPDKPKKVVKFDAAAAGPTRYWAKEVLDRQMLALDKLFMPPHFGRCSFCPASS